MLTGLLSGRKRISTTGAASSTLSAQSNWLNGVGRKSIASKRQWTSQRTSSSAANETQHDQQRRQSRTICGRTTRLISIQEWKRVKGRFRGRNGGQKTRWRRGKRQQCHFECCAESFGWTASKAGQQGKFLRFSEFSLDFWVFTFEKFLEKLWNS